MNTQEFPSVCVAEIKNSTYISFKKRLDGRRRHGTEFTVSFNDVSDGSSSIWSLDRKKRANVLIQPIDGNGSSCVNSSFAVSKDENFLSFLRDFKNDITKSLSVGFNRYIGTDLK